VAGRDSAFPGKVRRTAYPSASLLMTQGRADDRFSAAPTALGSSSGSISQPFRTGLTFGGWPSGPCHFSLNLPQASQLLGMTKGSATFLWKMVSGPSVLHHIGPSHHLPCNHPPLSSRAKPRDLQFRGPLLETRNLVPPTNLSSRPERSVVERSAVFLIGEQTPCNRYNADGIKSSA
jgi:hypothetical protein